MTIYYFEIFESIVLTFGFFWFIKLNRKLKYYQLSKILSLQQRVNAMTKNLNSVLESVEQINKKIESISLNYTTQFFENKEFKEEKEYFKTPIKSKVSKPKKNNKTNIPYLVENFLKGKYGEKQYLLYKQKNHKEYSSEYQKTYNYFYYKQKKIQDKTIIPNKFNITKTDKILF